MSQRKPADELIWIPTDQIEVDGRNPREDCETGVTALAVSVATTGIVQPPVVRRNADPNGRPYVIVCGERRYRAAKHANQKRVQCIVRDVAEEDALVAMLAENANRRSIDAIATAKATVMLTKPREKGGAGYTIPEASRVLGHDDRWLRRLRTLLRLPDWLQTKVANKKLAIKSALMLVPFAKDEPFLRSVDSDITAKPELWSTTAKFKRSLAILAGKLPEESVTEAQPKEQPDQQTPMAAATTTTPPRQPRKEPTDIESELATVDQICDLIASLETPDELNDVQNALDVRRQYIDQAAGRRVVA